MPGPEQDLDLEMQDVIAGRPPRTETYKGFRVVPGQLTGQGSANWPIDSDAINYSANGNALGARDRLLAFLLAERGRWMGNEEDSTIYGGMHLRAWAQIHAAATLGGDGELAAAVLDVGAVWFLLRLLGECPDAQILHVGFRSGGHDPRSGVAWDRATLALARHDSAAIKAAIAAGKKSGAAIAISPQWAAFKMLQPPLTAMLAQAEPWLSSLPAGVGLAQPIHFLTWRESSGAVLAQLAFLQGHDGVNGNGNTPPLMAALWQAGALSYLPAAGGKHFRQQLDVVEMTLTPGLLTYQSNKQGTQTLALPAGEPEHLVIGERASTSGSSASTAGPTATTGSLTPAGPPTPSGTAPEPPILPRTPAEIAADIRALQVSNRLAGKRNEIAQEVSGEIEPWRSMAEAADDLATLGKGADVAKLAAEVRRLGA
jgi:hypothetical protein